MNNQMMSAKDVAELLNLSVYTVYRLKDKADGLRAYKVGGCIRFKRSDVEEYLAGNTVEPVSRQEPRQSVRFKYVPGMKVV